MNTKLLRVEHADFKDADAPGTLVDPLTKYPCQIWEQLTLTPGLRRYIVLYLRKGMWQQASAAMTDRMMRAAGLQGLTDAPWGAGPEMGYSVDDLLDKQAEKMRQSPCVDVSRETKE